MKSADGRVATVATRREKNLVQRKNKRTHLTPTGLLMEGDSAQNPWPDHSERYRDFSPTDWRLVVRIASTKIARQSCHFYPHPDPASGMLRKPLIDAMSMRKKTGSIDRSLVCSRRSASGVRHHSEYSASRSRACSFSAVYSGSRNSTYVPFTTTLVQLKGFPISST